MSNFVDLTGKRFGRLVVIERVENDSGGHGRWLCKCDCGGNTITSTSHLNGGHTQSCGCYRYDRTVKHMKSYSNQYYAWSQMVQRCTNKNHSQYKDYGKRGITVCEKWLTFNGFYEDMGERPEGMTLDRKDNDGNYCKENCRWATNMQQQNNKRDNKYITFDGETHTQSEWSRIVNISKSTIRKRIKNKWSIKDTLTKPVEEKYNGKYKYKALR